MALDPSMDFLTRISNHGADSITGMGGDFRNNLFRMIYNAPPQIRDQMRIISGYRSPQRQAQLWDSAVRRYGSVEAARKWVAPPGRSRHNLGIAADLGFGSGGLGQAPKEVIAYLHRVAPQYGLEFPLGNEPWHIEPIGSRGGRGGGGAQGQQADMSGGMSYGGSGGTLQRAAEKYGIDPAMYARLVMKESSGNPQAVSPVGAVGLTQIMPATAKAFGIDVSTPEGQLDGGAKYLRYLLNRFNNDPKLALAAYNWGEGNVGRVGSFDAVPTSVKGYVESIMGDGPAVEAGQFNPASLQDMADAAPADVSGAPIEAGVAPKPQTNIGWQALGGILDAAAAATQVGAAAFSIPEKAVRSTANAMQNAALLDAESRAWMESIKNAPGSETVYPNPQADPLAEANNPLTTPVFKPPAVAQKAEKSFIEDISGAPISAGEGLVPQEAIPEWLSPTSFMASLGKPVAKFADRVAGGAPQTGLQEFVRRGTTGGVLGGRLGLGYSLLDTFIGQHNKPLDLTSKEFQVASQGAPGAEGYSMGAQAQPDALAEVNKPMGSNFPVAAPSSEFNLNFLGRGADAIGQMFVSPAEAMDFSTTPEFVRSLPRDVDKHAWEVLSGWPALASLGFIVAPWAYKAFKDVIPQKTFNLGPEYGPVGLESVMTRHGAMGSAFHDAWTSIFTPLKKAGADPQLLQTAMQAAKVETKAGAIHVANSMFQGIADTLSGVFNVGRQNAMFKLQLINRKVPELDEYLKLHHTLDDFTVHGRPSIRGMTYQDVSDAINRMKTAMPELEKFREMYTKNLDEWRSWMADGRAGLLTQKQKFAVMTSRPNQVPGYGVSLDNHLPNEPSAVDALASRMTYGSREKLDNQARLSIIDAANSTGKKLFKEVTEKQLKANPQWRHPGDLAGEKGPRYGSLTTVYEDGVKKYYVTTPNWAAVMKGDPYYVTSGFAQAAFAYKRITEELHTGWGNPGFAITNMVRNWQISKLTAPDQMRLVGSTAGRKGVGLTRTILAVPRQVIPLAARNMAMHIDAALVRGAGGAWSILPDNVKRNLSALLGDAWNKSHMAQMEEHGVHATAYSSQAAQLGIGKMRSMIESMPPSVQGIAKAINTTLYAIHGAPQAAYVMRNLARSKKYNPNWEDETRYIVAEGNALTGDPRVSGQSYRGEGGAMPGYPGAGLLQQRAEALTRGTGEFMRVSAPWFNVTIQGMKRLGKAYMDNPVSFVTRVWINQILPAVSIYLYNKGLNETPEAKAHGWDYTDHMIRERTPWSQMMNFSIGVYGRPPVENLEIPRFHEGSVVGRMIEVLLHHGMTSAQNQLFTTSEDLWRAAGQWASNVMMPAPPALIAGFQMLVGDQPSQNIFGAAPPSYKTGFEPHTGVGGFLQDTLGVPVDSTEANKYLENWVRGLGGALGNMVGAGYASGLKEAGKTAVKSIPVFGNYLSGDTPLLPSKTDITDVYKGKEAFIHKLADHYNESGKYFLQGKDPPIPLNPSKKAPTNPLYKLFMMRVYQDFMLKNPIKGMPAQDIGGFTRIMKAHTGMIKLRESLRGVDSSSMSDWMNQIKNNPNMQGWVHALPKEEQTDPRKMFNKVQKNIRALDEIMLLSIKKVEEQMSKEVGRPITIETLDPYGVVPPKTQ